MSNDSNDTKETGAPGAPAGKGKRLPLVIALLVGLTVGALAGSLVVGPLVAEGDTGGECACETDEEHGAVDSGGAPVAKPAFTVENMVLNPAQSGGNRYLVLSISFSVKDSTTVTRMKEREPELRDILIKVLGSKTVPQLSDMAARPALKAEVRAQAGRLFGEKTITDVFFPQFVIQ